MEKYGRELEFISIIGGDGLSVIKHPSGFHYNKYILTRLSLNYQTFIATDGNATYIVKIKPKVHEIKPKTHEIKTIEQLIKVATLDNIHELSKAFLEWLVESIDTKETTFIWTDKK